MAEEWLVRSAAPLRVSDVLEASGDVDPDAQVTSGPDGFAVTGAITRRAPPSRVRVRPAGAADDGAWTEVVGPTGSSFAPRLAQALARQVEGRADRRTTTDLDLPVPAVPAADFDAADAVTGGVLVLVSTAAVVHLGQAVLAAGRAAASSGRRLVLVTPPASVLTAGCATYLEQVAGAWVAVTDDRSAYDGRTGLRLHWDDGGETWTVTDPDDVHPAFAPQPTDAPVLEVYAETLHPYGGSTRVGALTAAVVSAAGWRPPRAYGVAEPLDVPWHVDTLTEVVRVASPAPAVLLGVSSDADLVLRAVPQPPGVVEQVRATGALRDWWTERALLDFARAALDAGAQTASLGYRPAGPGGHLPPRLVDPTAPAVTVVARSRLPGVGDDVLRETLGAGVVLLDAPVPALVVIDAAARPRPGSEAVLLGRLALARLLAEHDPVARAIARDRPGSEHPTADG